MFTHLPGATPLVSVLMPTYKHAAFIRRAIESLRAQTLHDWELVIVDDGSPDDTLSAIQSYLLDARVHYRRLERNGGLGAALNLCTDLARGRYIAYLPSDDVFYPEHLAELARLLERAPDIYLAYSGLRWAYDRYEATLQGNEAVGRETEVLLNPPPVLKGAMITSGNLFAPVQVMHRRELEQRVRWATRDEIESDTLERDFWRDLARQGARLCHVDRVSCEWVDHPDQRHKIIAGQGLTGGLSRFRQYYAIPSGQWLNWQPSYGVRVDERKRFGRFAQPRALPEREGLKILLVGDLGFNPERVVAFEERGHLLYGLWLPHPETWDTTGPLPFGNIVDIPFDADWRARVLELQPDVIYALLNWQAIEFIGQIFDAQLGIPFVFHFKEGPFICQEKGTWPTLIRLLSQSDGRIFSSEEACEWFQLATGGLFDSSSTFVLDGDLPKIDWFGDDWAPKLSARTGEIHTVCPGRPLGLDPFDGIAAARIHVHFYGDHFHQAFPNWTRNGLATGYMHLHPTVEPDEWVRELSRYDAAWFHLFESYNGGDLRRAHWDDLNLPARLGTYAAAGLPWILKDQRGSRTAVQNLARQHDVGIFFRTFDQLAAQLRDRDRMDELTANMRNARRVFAFDTHVDALVAFLRMAIARCHERRSQGTERKPKSTQAQEAEQVNDPA